MSLGLSSLGSGEADRLFGARARRLARVGLPAGRELVGHCRRVAVDLAQLEQVGRPHRAQRVALALFRIDMNLHVPFIAIGARVCQGSMGRETVALTVGSSVTVITATSAPGSA